MFTDQSFGCCTITSVQNEFVRTQKFKQKYPWRTNYAKHIRVLPRTPKEYEEVNLYFQAIDLKLKEGVINRLKDEFFDLSRTDKRVLAWSLAMKLPISTGDKGIVAFGHQEFKGRFKRHVSSLAILNAWIQQDLVKWTATLDGYLKEWKDNDEQPQPPRQKRRFRQLTGHRYPGS